MLEFDQCFSVDFWNTTVLPNARFSTSLPLSTKCHSSQLLWQRQQQKPSTHFQTAPEASCCLSPAEMRLSHKFQNPHTGQKTNQNTCQPQSLPSHLPSQESLCKHHTLQSDWTCRVKLAVSALNYATTGAARVTSQPRTPRLLTEVCDLWSLHL